MANHILYNDLFWVLKKKEIVLVPLVQNWEKENQLTTTRIEFSTLWAITNCLFHSKSLIILLHGERYSNPHDFLPTYTHDLR
jgi:hypothetical protein